MDVTINDQDNIPQQAIKGFVRSIPGNQNLELIQGAKYRGLNKELGLIEDLPQLVQNIIKDIGEATSVEEKAAMAHSFSQVYIVDEIQSKFTERDISFEELAKDPRGDCDDHEQFTTGLLLHGGVNPRDVFMLRGQIKYLTNGEEILSPHALVVVKSEHDYLLLDSNLVGTPIIDPHNPIVNGILADENGAQFNLNGMTNETSVEIVYLASAVDGRGTPFISIEAENKLYNNNTLDQSDAQFSKTNGPNFSL